MTTTTPKARLGAALRAIRSQMRLTLADVSARTGVSVSTLSKVENGQGGGKDSCVILTR
jgi:transcriptional regulator with XRE-family HTH domain